MSDLPPGLYEHVITTGMQQALGDIETALVQQAPLPADTAHEALAAHVARVARVALRAVPGEGAARLDRQVELANELVRTLVDAASEAFDAGQATVAQGSRLLAIAAKVPIHGSVQFPARPDLPFSAGALLVNGRGQPRIGLEVKRELESADGVDLLCAFVKWAGLRIVEAELAKVIERGGTVRVITTTYMGATEQRALDRLVELGAEVKVSFDTHNTRLHAKAWFFRRRTGLDTAYVGSSNLSAPAMLDGLEWNLRVSTLEQPDVMETFAGTFNEYWNDPQFESYDPDRDGDRLSKALAAERGGPTSLPLAITTIDVEPRGYQREILEALTAEREVHSRWHNLVVMATGTGKTVVAALDYRRLREQKTVRSLLFIAHREEILKQSQSVFRQVLKQGDFGELLVGGQLPSAWQHVFASVQSLSHVDLDHLDPDHFDMVIVDEFHHAMAPSYQRLLEHLQPKVLVGLTATPERADGLDVRKFFDGRTAVELRLWEALDRGLLAPFQYFGCYDEVDLDSIKWSRSTGYDVKELERLYTGNDARARLILREVRDKISDAGAMRAIGFCVSVQHAEYMARRFTEAGIPSSSVTSATQSTERARALGDLRARAANVLFTVDLFNEGIDLPEIDTVFFLRPTESLTVFLQQLGRGLRLSGEKPCLTVLDFIGGQNQELRFDLRYRALTGASRRGLERQIREGFPTLPAGCHIQLDSVAQKVVLDNVRSALRVSWKTLTEELVRLGDVSLETFLAETGVELDDLYRTGKGGWTALRRAAGLEERPETAGDLELSRRLARSLHIDDSLRLDVLRKALDPTRPDDALESAAERRAAQLLAVGLFGPDTGCGTTADLGGLLRTQPARAEELGQIADLLWSRIERPTVAIARRFPLRVHARYTRDETLTAFGVTNPQTVREGVKWVEAERADVFFVTLTKNEEHYSPSTMYADRAISPELFQWESQSTTSVDSPTAQRYINHRQRGSAIHLFIRESKAPDGALGVPPYLYAGPIEYVSHTGSRPVRFVWRLAYQLPDDVFQTARLAS